MKAFLLAAGLGTRLRPLTNRIPKCLVLINGKPLLAYWIELMERHKITDVLISMHHFTDQIKAFIATYESYSINFHFYEETALIGSAGSLRDSKDFVSDTNDFFIFYADNLTNINLTDFLAYHHLKKQSFTMALNRVVNPSRCGIAELNNDGIITSFIEKPKEPRSNLANAGVYVAKPEVLNLIPEKHIADIGYDLLPQLVGRMAGWKTKDYLLDIGTLENLDRAQKEWPFVQRSY